MAFPQICQQHKFNTNFLNTKRKCTFRLVFFVQQLYHNNSGWLYWQMYLRKWCFHTDCKFNYHFFYVHNFFQTSLLVRCRGLCVCSSKKEWVLKTFVLAKLGNTWKEHILFRSILSPFVFWKKKATSLLSYKKFSGSMSFGYMSHNAVFVSEQQEFLWTTNFMCDFYQLYNFYLATFLQIIKSGRRIPIVARLLKIIKIDFLRPFKFIKNILVIDCFWNKSFPLTPITFS